MLVMLENLSLRDSERGPCISGSVAYVARAMYDLSGVDVWTSVWGSGYYPPTQSNTGHKHT